MSRIERIANWRNSAVPILNPNHMNEAEKKADIICFGKIVIEEYALHPIPHCASGAFSLRLQYEKGVIHLGSDTPPSRRPLGRFKVGVRGRCSPA
jgi:hypothetical protein